LRIGCLKRGDFKTKNHKMRTAAKRDKNEKAIVATLEALGATVIRINQKDTFDLLVAYRGSLYAIEVKNPEYRPKQKPPDSMLTAGELKCKMSLEQKGVKYHIVFTSDDVCEILM